LHRKIALSLVLTTMMLASMFLFAVPVAGVFEDIPSPTGRQIVAYGNLHNETFPEWNFTYWEKQGIELGFTNYGEMVTEQDHFATDSEFGVGLSYPAGDELVAEHIATPMKEGEPYCPIEGWQLFWKWNATLNPVLVAVDPEWHIHMAIYGNESSPGNVLARLCVKTPEELYGQKGVEVITDTSRLFAARVTVYLYNETLALAPINANPLMFKLVATYVLFKNTKKVVQFWDLTYLGATGVDVVFRRLTDFDIDEKYQVDYESEGYTVFFHNGNNATANIGKHVFWTGCDYWPQNYSLAVTWTNSSITHWTEPDASHHVGFIAYYPNCSNWNTDDWNYYLYNIWPFRTTAGRAAWFALNPLNRRYGDQPTTRQVDPPAKGLHFASDNLIMGQWNFTLTSATTRRKAQFVNVIGITNCSDTFGYSSGINRIGTGDKYSGDWDSGTELGGGRTISEIKYLLGECFNATYKLSSEHADGTGQYYDLGDWFPFSGVQSSRLGGVEWMYNNSRLRRDVLGNNPRNTTFIYGDSVAHNGMVFTSGAAHVVDVVGGTEVGEAFGSYIGLTGDDPWWEAMWDTAGFTEGAAGPFYGTAPNFFKTVAGKDYLDGSGEYVPLSWKFSGWRRVQNRTIEPAVNLQFGKSEEDWNLFTTPTGQYWDVNHTICLGGPKVNLAAEYFNDHTWAIWTSSASGCEIPDLANGGIYVLPSGNYYGAGYSVITIVEDLNLTSQNTIFDEYQRFLGGANFSTDPNERIWDGPTLVDPYAGLLIWGYSGWDTRSAANWLAQYWINFHSLYTNATAPVKRGVTTIVLYTPKIAGCVDYGWEYGVAEILGPVAGRWRFSTGAWDLWISIPCSIVW